jgi:cell fate (sporulation/competence/biofilm development) regulator YlbF (YheA/YmcA/DUF963 family)
MKTAAREARAAQLLIRKREATMTDILSDKARELGRMLGQSSEYQALSKARERLSNDRAAVTSLNRLAELEDGLAGSLQRGEEPPEEMRTEYETVFSELQASPIYQSVVAAQSNFDKVLTRVNEDIGKGIDSGAQSRIILPS